MSREAGGPTVTVDLPEGRGYRIHIASGDLARAGEIAVAATGATRAVVITQPAIARLWGAPLSASLAAAGIADASLLTFPAGERFKTLGTIAKLYEKLYALEPALDRGCLIVALGGGVVGDVAGYVAASYLRGLRYVQIPTTLLAMVDSSVGGKTGVDFREGKNLIGAFHQPRSVVIDPATLTTLPVREFRSGMAEVIKYGVIRDPELLTEVAERGDGLRGDPAALGRIIARCCAIKAEVVTRDEFERTGVRAGLNFGHTVGHAIESATGYRVYKHGEAVGLGMIAAAGIGQAVGVTPPDVLPAIVRALKAVGLPIHLPSEIGPDALLPLLGRDKKSVGGVARFVLCRRLGEVEPPAPTDSGAVLRGLQCVYAG